MAQIQNLRFNVQDLTLMEKVNNDLLKKDITNTFPHKLNIFSVAEVKECLSLQLVTSISTSSSHK